MYPTTNTQGQTVFLEKSLNIPSTRKPPVPKDRAPQMVQTPKKPTCGFLVPPGGQPELTDAQQQAARLRESLVRMIASFLKHSPKASQVDPSDLRKFMRNMEICLGIRPGRLNLAQWGKLLIQLDEIAPFKDGDLCGDLEIIDQFIANYKPVTQ